jgi:photosystem II stability/assembly factor-like uncharacterized protein
MADRHFGTDPEANLAELRQMAVAQVAAMAPVNETPTTPATPGGSNWVPLGPLAIVNGQTYGGARVIVTGRVTEIVSHPTDPLTIYVATARGGIWKTTDGGVTWSPMSDNAISLAIGSLGIAPSSPSTLYAGTGEGNIYFYALSFPLDSINASYNGSGIIKSIDGGVNWTTQAAALFTGSCFYRIKVHPTNANFVFAASNKGLYRTTDGGTTWVQMTNGLPAISASVIAATDVVFDPVTPTTAYVAFWASGIYKTTNAAAANPSWTKLAGGLPTSDLSRIAIAVSPTSPLSVYALCANAGDSLKGVFASSNGGTSWTSVPAAVVQVYGAYTLNVAVDISTPDVVYLSGVSLYKAVRTMGTWTVTEVGANIHPDNHAFASHPTNHLVIYAGSDSGIYKSSNGGTSWDDSINEGICITQFEFIDQHPTSAAVVIGGTQDNGTEQFRNSPAFYHSADGDGGAAGIDQSAPRNVIHTFFGATPERSTQGGNFGTYGSVSGGLTGAALFYPPFTYDQTNSQNIAFGTDRINLDAAQGTGGWPTKVTLPGISGRVSAISYVNSTLIFAGTSSGQVYRLVKTGGTWAATAIGSAPLPARWIWDIQTLPLDSNAVILVMAGFGTPHVWRGAVAAGGGSATWSDISGAAPDRVPDIPVNSLCIDPVTTTTLYVGTDIGVFRTLDSGAHWQQFSDGLPNSAVYDLKLHAADRLLRAATHGRGLWERKLDIASLPNVDIYVRDHLLDAARTFPTPSPVTATFDDPLQGIALGNSLWWWMCADAKVDSPAPITHTFQLPVAAVDYLAFETKLAHRNPQRTATNRVYVQIHNRGIQPGTSVTVKILYADASSGLPNLPANFWTAFPGNGTTTFWKPIGAAKTIASISPTRPEILEWDWVPPSTAAQHSCLLVVADCAADPIPAAHKVFDIATLVTQDKRVGLRNLHVVDAVAGPLWSRIHVWDTIKASDLLTFLAPSKSWSAGVLLPKAIQAKIKSAGLKAGKLTKAQSDELARTLGDKEAKLYNPKDFQAFDPDTRATIGNFPETKGFDLLLTFLPQRQPVRSSFTIVHRAGEKVVGGNTFLLQPKEGA